MGASGEDAKVESDSTESTSAKRDRLWKEFELPPLPSGTSRSNAGARGLTHHAEVEVDLLISSAADHGKAGSKLVHYLDANALAPTLSFSDSDRDIVFAKVGSKVRPEIESELRKSRYGLADQSRQPRARGRDGNGNGNGGGGRMHTAKVWQGEEKRRAEEVKRGKDVKMKGFVVQTRD